MKKTLPLTVLAAIAVFGAIFGYKYLQIRRGMAAALAAQAGLRSVTVSATAARAEAWPNTLSAVASLASYRGITVRSEAEGTIRRVAFESGSAVAEGALLVELDVSVELAQLTGLEAQARLAEINLGRARELRANSTNTQADLDAAEASLAQARAAVGQLRATIAKKQISAAFAGRLGIAQVHPGQFLGKGDPIVQLEILDPIHVDFTLPQQDIGLARIGQPVHVRVDAFPGRTFEGAVSAIDPRVDQATRSISLRATLANRDEALRPGMFGNVEVMLPESENTVVLPTAAIVYNPYGDFVYVIENGAAHQRFVRTGRQRGNLIAILSGLKPGESVVTSGQIKLRNGSPVQVDNTAAPSADPAPKPAEG